MGKYNIHELLTEGEKLYSSHGYIYERSGDSFKGVTYNRFVKDVRKLASALISDGLKDENIILFGGNSYNYMVTDTAIMGYVGVSCTLSKEWSARDLTNAAKLLTPKAIIYSEQKSETVGKLKNEFPDIKYYILEEILSLKSDEDLSYEHNMGEKCVKIIFSSGTTGLPKAVMLSQDNMFANWENLKKRAPFCKDDKDYLFLPLSHTYGGICNFLYSLITGMSIYICSDTKLIMEELQIVKPTAFCSVPLIFEKMYSACVAGNISPKVLLGGNIRYLFSGGAYLKPEIRKLIKDDGISFFEAYGLTETSSLISCEYDDKNDFESVGTILENIEVRISEADENGVGEITAKGNNIFSSYYKNPEATQKAFDNDGFFHTGDLGYIIENKLYVVGRKRRMILLSNGENVYPDEIEALFSVYKNINRVKVYERGGVIFVSLYVAEKIDADAVISEVNNNLPKFSAIKGYELIEDSIEARIK